MGNSAALRAFAGPAPGQTQGGASAVAATRAALPARLVVGVLASERAPFEMIEDGKLAGFSADYLRLATGPGTTLVARAYADMSKLVAAACAGEVDVIMSVIRTPARERCLAFTEPYLNSAAAFVTRAGSVFTIAGGRLDRARIAVERGAAFEQMLRERYPRARVDAYARPADALHAVQAGSDDAFVGFTPAVRHLLVQGAFGDLAIAYEERVRQRELRFAVPLARAQLRDRLDLLLAHVRAADSDALAARWLDAGHRDTPLALEPDAASWLRGLPPLGVAFAADRAPFTFVDAAGQPVGIAGDYLDYLARVLGLTFVRVPYADAQAANEALERGDVALLASASPDMAPGEGAPRGARVTAPYEHYPLVMVGRRGEPVARAIADFATRRIVLAPHARLPHSVTDALAGAQMLRAASVEAGLQMLARGEADVLLGDAASVDAALEREYGAQLKILGPLVAEDAAAFALRPDLARLGDLIDRALQAMPAAERARIAHRWVTGGAAPRSGWSVNALRLLPVLIASLVVLLVTLRAYLLLQREVRRRRSAERVIARQLDLQQTMMEMIPYPLTAQDLERRYIAVNRAFEDATGRRRAEVLGGTTAALALWGTANSGDIDAMYDRALALGDAQRAELTFDGPGGETRHGIFWVRACADGKGKSFCVLGTMIDITDIRRADLRARATERRLSDVTRSLPAIVFQLRRAPDGSYSFLYLGGDTQRLLGDDGSALLQAAQIDSRCVHRHDRARLVARLERSARELAPVHTEFRFAGVAGCLWTRAEFAPRREDDGAVVWSGYAVDASVEHARADELARARDMARAASRAKDDFLAMMSHEIRTPMNGVLGLVEVLERTPLNPDQTEMVGMVHESAGALLQILDDLLDYSKIEAGRLALGAEPFDVRDLVDHAVGLLAGRAHEKGLKVRVYVAREVAAVLLGDSVRLRQILFNLLSNAIKFTARGEVSVRVETAAVDEASDGGHTQRLVLSVADTGIGIAPEAQVQLFEPFVQAESSTTRRFGGTGLGLTICRKLAALMGGTLCLQSRPGEGTCMSVALDLPVESRVCSAGGLRGKHVLVACADAGGGSALMEFGAALGMTMERIAPDALAPRLHEALAQPDLVFACESTLHGLAQRPAVPVITLTENPKPTGYRVVGSGVRLSMNPISWRGLGAACAMALAGLPAAPAWPAAQAEPVMIAPDREKERRSGRLILVAEDHPVNQELIRHQLALLGFACDVVSDGEEALAALACEDYGCLITDCHMPNVSGYDLARQLREREGGHGATRRLPVLGITANTAPENLRQCREAGMDDCLIKPTRLATLREYLARWFGAEGTRRGAQPPDAPPVPAGMLAGEASTSAFEPLDIARMAEVWGSEATVKALLQSFVTAVRDDLRALPSLLEEVDVMRLREWHHRLAGAVGVLQYPALLGLLEAYRRQMETHSAEQLRREGRVLIGRCESMLDGIEQQMALLA